VGLVTSCNTNGFAMTPVLTKALEELDFAGAGMMDWEVSLVRFD
jgi:hypothetical protein